MQQRYSIVFDGLRRRRRCEEVRDPKIEHPRDASMKLNACTICGTVARMVSR
jgi:threonine dehydrogenase-like Zn-dependent dehydrogenase